MYSHISLTTSLLALAASCAYAARAVPALPSLPWQPRSDWLSVTSFGAKGDGHTDDTAAVQAGLTAISFNTLNKTLFFPPGVYVITSTLVLNTTLGGSVVGCGRDSTLLWGGVTPVNTTSTLFWSDGNTRFWMEGIVFDGAGGADIGLDHRSRSQYESRFMHRNLEFRNFVTAGIRVGFNQYTPPGVASAEMTYVNCLFHNNSAGVTYLSWNDYDNYFTGCLFSGNGWGILAFAGNYYVHNSRFEYNTQGDSTLTGHANSFRRVVSVGSPVFLQTVGGGQTKVHQSVVHGWGTVNTSAAIINSGAPIQVIDCIFSNPVNASSPGVALNAGPGGVDGVLITSNLTSINAGPALDPGSTYNMTEHFALPAGDPAVAALLPAIDENTQFFSSVWPISNVVFDAVEQFGADNTGRNMSQAGIIACIAAASKAGNGAICYLRPGSYHINATIPLCGADFVLQGGGSGFGTIIAWAAPVPPNGVTLATGPGAGCAESRNITIRTLQLFTAGQPTWVDLAVSRPTQLPPSYNGAYNASTLAGGGDASSPVSIILDSLYFTNAVVAGLTTGDSVTGPHADGSFTIVDSDDAVIMINFYCIDGVGLTIARSPAGTGKRSGFLGFQVLIAAGPAFDIWAFNSSSVAITDHYTETSHSNVFLSGDGASPPGRVAISAAKMNLNGPPWVAAVVDNYSGLFFHTGSIASYDELNVTVNGTAPVHVLFLGESLWVNATNFDVSNPNAELSLMGLAYANGGRTPFAPDVLHPDSLALAASGMDAFRELGHWDMVFNYPAYA